MDEYRQMKESLRRAPIPNKVEQKPVAPREVQADAPDSHVQPEPQAAIPVHDNHQIHKDPVTRRSFLRSMQLKSFNLNILVVFPLPSWFAK